MIKRTAAALVLVLALAPLLRADWRSELLVPPRKGPRPPRRLGLPRRRDEEARGRGPPDGEPHPAVPGREAGRQGPGARAGRGVFRDLPRQRSRFRLPRRVHPEGLHPVLGHLEAHLPARLRHQSAVLLADPGHGPADLGRRRLRAPERRLLQDLPRPVYPRRRILAEGLPHPDHPAARPFRPLGHLRVRPRPQGRRHRPPEIHPGPRRHRRSGRGAAPCRAERRPRSDPARARAQGRPGGRDLALRRQQARPQEPQDRRQAHLVHFPPGRPVDAGQKPYMPTPKDDPMSHGGQRPRRSRPGLQGDQGAGVQEAARAVGPLVPEGQQPVLRLLPDRRREGRACPPGPPSPCPRPRPSS